MWESHSHPWQACVEEAWNAYCAGSIPVGAVITDAGGRILARERNHIYDNDGGKAQVHHNPLAHAELNVLLALNYRGIDPHPYILYTTTEPCPLCFGAFYMSGIRELRFACRDPYAGRANLLGTTSYLSRKPIRVAGPQRADLEAILMAMHAEMELGHREGGDWPVLDTWRAVCPRGFGLGEHLHQTGLLGQMRDRRLTAAAMLDGLESSLATVIA